MFAYLTDVEGHWDKLVDFATDNPCVMLEGGERLVVADGARFVFGGDAVDRGPAGRRVVATLLAAKRRQPEQVVLLAGNRDLNKLRLARELTGAPPSRAPQGLPRPELLRWILAKTMGAADAFAMRQQELAALGEAASDDDVVDSYVADVETGGLMLDYLQRAQLAVALGETLLVHGGISDQSLGWVPERAARIDEAPAWIDALNGWYRSQLDAFVAAPRSTTAWQPLIAYQAPTPGANDNLASVVYRRMLDDAQRPQLPSPAARAYLRRAGIRRLVVGHTPMGDAPTIVRAARDRDDDAPFELVMADNSYSRLERGSLVQCGPAGALRLRGRARLDDGEEVDVEVGGALGGADAATPLGNHDPATGAVVKGRLADRRWHLFRHVANRQVEQVAITDAELAARGVQPAP